MSFKRGYLLTGHPGTGKTSVIKAIANKYGVPVFSLDMALIKHGSTLSQLMNDATNISRGMPHIIAFEDIDRCNVFKKKGQYFNNYDSPSDNDINIGTFLNILDGVMEPFGRIVIMTVNDISPLTNVDSNALIRPGRIDVVVDFEFCNHSQVQKFFHHFYDQEVPFTVPADIVIPQKLTPATVIQSLMKFPNEPEKALKNFIESEKACNTSGGVPGKSIVAPTSEGSKLDVKFVHLRSRIHYYRKLRHLTLRDKQRAEHLLKMFEFKMNRIETGSNNVKSQLTSLNNRKKKLRTLKIKKNRAAEGKKIKTPINQIDEEIKELENHSDDYDFTESSGGDYEKIGKESDRQRKSRQRTIKRYHENSGDEDEFDSENDESEHDLKKNKEIISNDKTDKEDKCIEEDGPIAIDDCEQRDNDKLHEMNVN